MESRAVLLDIAGDEMNKTTDKDVLEFIARFIKRNGYQPNFREIGQGCGLASKCAVSYRLDNLERSGLIKKTPNTGRGIVLVG